LWFFAPEKPLSKTAKNDQLAMRPFQDQSLGQDCRYLFEVMIRLMKNAPKKICLILNNLQVQHAK